MEAPAIICGLRMAGFYLKPHNGDAGNHGALNPLHGTLLWHEGRAWLLCGRSVGLDRHLKHQ